MCKVYEFPKQLELPEEERDLLELLGEAYAKALYNSLAKTVGAEATHEEMEEVNMLAKYAFLRGINRGVEQMEES